MALATGAVAWWLATESILAISAAAILVSLALWWETRGTLRFRRLVPTAFVIAGTVAGISTALQIRRVERAWPETRERLLDDAGAVFQTEVQRAVARAEGLVERAAAFETDSRVVGFRAIDRAIDKGATDHGVVVMDVDGGPWAWGGVLRAPPRTFGPPLAARMTAFYVFVEARRQDERRSVVSQVVLAADSAVPDRERTLAARFTAATGVGLVFRTSLPDSQRPVAVFCKNSCVPSGAMPVDTLLIAELVPPAQGAAKIGAQRSGGRWTVGLWLIGLMIMMVFGTLLGRWVGLLGATVLLIATPAAGLIGMGAAFSSASYYVATLGPFSASAGAPLSYRPSLRGCPAPVFGGVAFIRSTGSHWITVGYRLRPLDHVIPEPGYYAAFHGDLRRAMDCLADSSRGCRGGHRSGRRQAVGGKCVTGLVGTGVGRCGGHRPVGMGPCFVGALCWVALVVRGGMDSRLVLGDPRYFTISGRGQRDRYCRSGGCDAYLGC